MYTKQIMDRFLSPKNSGRMIGADGTGSASNLRNGETARIYLRVNEGIIEEAKFKVFGGITTIAVFDEAMDMLKGQETINASINDEEIVSHLGFIEAERLYVFKLLKDTLADAIKDYEKRQKRLELKKIKEQARESANKDN